RLGILVQDMGYRDEVVGKFFSKEYINKKVLKLTADEIEEIKDQMEQEKLEGQPPEGAEPEGGQPWEEYAAKPDLKVISG
ncbi:uncharacterized protein METZ01_LOCUS510018, partial [marine metagenome]